MNVMSVVTPATPRSLPDRQPRPRTPLDETLEESLGLGGAAPSKQQFNPTQNLRGPDALATEWNVRDADLVLHNRHRIAGLFLFVTVNRFERNRPLAILLMILLLGVTAAAVLKQLMP